MIAESCITALKSKGLLFMTKHIQSSIYMNILHTTYERFQSQSTKSRDFFCYGHHESLAFSDAGALSREKGACSVIRVCGHIITAFIRTIKPTHLAIPLRQGGNKKKRKSLIFNPQYTYRCILLEHNTCITIIGIHDLCSSRKCFNELP